MRPHAEPSVEPASDAREEVRAALRAEDPTAALREVAIDIARRGPGREGAEAAFASVCQELTDTGRAEDAALVAFVLDMIAEW